MTTPTASTSRAPTPTALSSEGRGRGSSLSSEGSRRGSALSSEGRGRGSSPGNTPAAARSYVRRLLIMKGAAQVFADGGFAGTSMEDVALECGVSRLVLYRHFPSKEDLYRAILERVFDDLREQLQLGLDIPSRYGLGARTLVAVARRNPNSFRLLWRQAAYEPDFAAYAAELRRKAVGVVRQLAAIDTGDEEIDGWRAHVLFNWLVDATIEWIEYGSEERDAEFIEHTTTGLHALMKAWVPRHPWEKDPSSEVR